MEQYLRQYVDEARKQMGIEETYLREAVGINHRRVLDAFRQERVTDFHFNSSTGYGYGDQGREVLESVFARVFGAEAALVRGQIVSGTHAIYLGLKAMVSKNEKLIYLGNPYDTLKTALGLNEDKPRPHEFNTEIFPLDDSGCVNFGELSKTLNGAPDCVLAIQRSCGYDPNRRSFSMEYIKRIVDFVRQNYPKVRLFVDNCYGEFVEDKEPPMLGVDLTAGSLIKNPGGGIAPGGGYLVGKEELIEIAAELLTAPGLGKDVGASLWDKRLVFQGLFLAPLIVLEALCGMIFSSNLLSTLGFGVSPAPREQRTDIIQRIDFGSRELLLAFCRGIQKYSPIDSQVIPQPGPLPGYAHPVIMAAGTFVQGGSLELSSDAPIHEPFSAFLQGGLSREYTIETVVKSIEIIRD
ncbi:methionine gamma-lyase family protein [Metallumcola ferriviriculae]|uniref:Methionine gamma-lyase family protein n=1 Tax=Metallumcola ferriviriculae TaxID=3039180 RepID=A0AAU0UM01_9FIRM|nr:methionine gamma-lyase family protein [Desulfitibacteraceae bacterium MK1]